MHQLPTCLQHTYSYMSTTHLLLHVYNTLTPTEPRYLHTSFALPCKPSYLPPPYEPTTYIPALPLQPTLLYTYHTCTTNILLCGVLVFCRGVVAFCDRILCAANLMCKIVRFECESRDWFESLLKKGGVLISPEKLQCWQIAHPFLLRQRLFIVARTHGYVLQSGWCEI